MKRTPIYRSNHRKHLLVFALTILTLAATLPAMGDLNYLKKNYTYLEKIPVKKASSYTDGFTYDSDQKQTAHLLDDNKNTQWISWQENVIWAEDYSTDRYFTETAIDGTNATKTTSGNNVLTVEAKAGGDWRQHIILEGYDDLRNLKKGKYTLRMRYRGDVAASSAGNVYLGRVKNPDNDGDKQTEYYSPILDVTPTWKEADFVFDITDDIDNAYCSIQPGSYPGTFEIDWAELTYEADETSPYSYLVDYSTLKADAYTTDTQSHINMTLENGCIDTYYTGGWYQFNLANGINLVSGNHYRAKLQIKGTEAGELVLWCGPFKGKKFDVPTTGIGNVEIDLGVCQSNNSTWMALQTCDLDNEQYKSYLGHITVKQVILEHEIADGNWVEDKKVEYKDFQNWPEPFRNGTEYIPALVEDNGRVVAKITGSNIGNNDRFRFATGMTLVRDSYKLKARIKASVNSGENNVNPLKLILGTGGTDTRGTISINLEASEDYVEYVVPVNPVTMPNGETNNPMPARDDYWLVYDINNYRNDFSVESFELISDPEHPVTTSGTIRNDGDEIGPIDVDQREVVTIIENGKENSIIRSYPLPTTRKVIVATGDGSHGGEQYQGQDGFNLVTPHVYTVSYKIKSDRAVTVTTLLSKSEDLSNLNGNDWNESQAIGKSDTIQLQPGVMREVRTSISTTNGAYSKNGAVVLDLGYDLGRVEVYDLKICDNYDSAIQDQKPESNTKWTQTGEITKNGEMDVQQVQVMDGLKDYLNSNETYTVTVRMKATKAGKLCLKLGAIWPADDAKRKMVFENFPASSDWQNVIFTVSNVPDENLGLMGLQLQTTEGSNTYDGIVNIQYVQISTPWEDDMSKQIAWDFKDGYSYDTYATGNPAVNTGYPKVEGGKLVVKNYDGNSGFSLLERLEKIKKLELGRKYRLYVKSQGTNQTDFRSLLGEWGNGTMAVGEWLPVNTTLGETFVEYDRGAPVETGIIVLQTRRTVGDIEIESCRLVPNLNERVTFYSEGTGDVWKLSDYKDFQISDNGLQLNVQSKPITYDVSGELTLTPYKSYSAEFEISAAPGRYIVAFGEGATSVTREITISEEEANKYVKRTVDFGPNAVETGSLTISPVAYTATLKVRNTKITEYTPGFKQGDMIGTDFFDVELGDLNGGQSFTLDKEGKYLFHLGYETDGNGTAAAETPKSIMIAASSSPNGPFTRLGLCERIDIENGNAFYSSVNSPLKNIEDWSNFMYVRVYCIDNEGGQTAICFPKNTNGQYDKENPYVGSMMRANRFAIYKQSTMFATDKATPGIGTELTEETYDKYQRWAIPVVSRFQIEALGQKYAYPGANLDDMLGVKKDAEVAGELSDNDLNAINNSVRITYWDTTLPLLKDENRTNQDRYQYLEYGKFQYPAEDNKENRNYDCIDLLLPDMKKLGAVKKYNGRIDNEKGYYQVVVSMGRSTGDVDAFANRLVYHVTRNDTTYDYNKPLKDKDGNLLKDNKGNQLYEYTVNTVTLSDETPAFKNRANGFPIEISYQGLTIDGNHGKTAKPIENSERIITFPTVAAGDSIHFALKVEEGWNGVRIFCRENHGNLERRAGGTKTTNKAETDHWNIRVVDVTNNDPVPGTRIMRLGELRAYVELDKIDLETKDGRERYDLLYNKRENFSNRGWKHTKGIIDDINNVNSVNNETTYPYMNKVDGKTWEDVLKTYKDFFEEQGIEIPDFSLIENPFDDEDVVPANGMKRDRTEFDGQKRQRSYTILHEVLALPGERVDLYPQSDIWMPNGWNYEEQFVRWYDYLTDKAPDYLYFFADPRTIIKTKDAGFIGGKTLLDHGFRGKGTVASVYFNVNDANPDWSFTDSDGKKKMKDQWVAADFSLAFNNKLQERLSRAPGEKEDTIDEPVINFRHLFHITSGSLFAENNMATAEGNRHYAKSNRRYISSLTDKTFRIRLDQAMPADEGTKSPFYYKTTKKNEKGEPVYERIRDYEIRTYKLGDNQTSDDYIKGISYDTRNRDEVIDTIFKMDDSSIFNHIDSYVQTTTPSGKWLRNSKKFARAIKCRKEHTANTGRYLVRLYGKDADGKVIKLTGKDETGKVDVEVPLVIAEYEVEFLDSKHASFISEENLAKIKEGDDQEHHTEKYLDEHYRNGKGDVKVVDFDKYTILKSKNQIVDKNSAPVNFDKYGFFEYKDWGIKSWRLKLPIAWGNSNYGFGYYSQGDYNMFRLADNSALTPYKDAAVKRANNPVDAEFGDYTTDPRGTYDRLFYNTNGEKKGLFYYVNAAADPGEMVKMDFDYLCPGSTIYVSAWVNEFNQGQAETANVIFNFFANVAKDVDGKKTILRQEQIHGFATGYVKKNPEDNYENGGTTGGDQGKWMHVYYSFVPDESHADVLKSDGEYIDSYYLVLENNCLSSSGADYAIDDIRAYVVAPRVDAAQSNALCEKNDVKVDIQVELPLEALETSLAGNAVPEDGIVRLQYSMVDKVKYDEILDQKRKGLTGDQELMTDDYYDAFAQSVLHYKRENVRTDKDGTLATEPLSWGMIEFYMDYKNKDDSEVIPVSINGETLTVGQYKEKYIKTIEKEKCFVFTTHPVSDNPEEYNDDFNNKHRNYYIVVDNIGTTGVFNSFFYEYDENGELKLDDNKNPILKEEYKDVDINSIWNAAVYPSLAKKDEWRAYDKELAKAYQICTECARMAEFSLRSAAMIVVDGVIHETDDNIVCCENQRPVVQIDLKAKEKDKEPYSYDDLIVVDDSPLSENPYLDWWNGSFETFAAQTTNIDVPGSASGVKCTLWDVLDYFRRDYPNSDTWNVPCVGEKDKDGNLLPTGATDEYGNPLTDDEGKPRVPKNYTAAMRSYLQGLCATSKVDETTNEIVAVEPKLVLHKSSYMFPQSETILVDKNGKKVKSKDIYVTAIPLSFPTLVNNKEDGLTYVICTQPREIKITVSNTSPTLFNGFKDITYPATIEDVPLRIGLKQLSKISADANAETAVNNLYVPLRNVNPATFDVTKFKKLSDDENVYLVETNDPEYRRLSDYKAPDDNEPDKTMYSVERMIAGKVNNIATKFQKQLDGSVKLDEDVVPMAQISFINEVTSGNKLPKGITFREGYFYKFRFGFEEDTEGSELYKQPGFEAPCKGQTAFSIKVVPEYQVWTGDSSLNYNNDDNWRRVKATDVLANANVEGGNLSSQTDWKDRFTVDGSNENEFSYAPLDFTKVIIPAGSTYPQLAAKRHSNGSGGVAENASEKPIANGKETAKYVWANSTPKAVTAAGSNSNKESSVVGGTPNVSYHPTLNIQYDMAATTYSDVNNVYCRPWYANACEQIHFNSNAEILNQQNLDYQKAWVDMEMKPHRWYTVASPLYDIFAGDMYLPKADARQATELFTDIEYNTDLNDRFEPAVYQRGWDKGTETVYNIDGNSTGCPDSETVALASTWSHVYNDVAEQYAPGAGYSVKTDVTRVGNFADTDLVKFRFPKADTFYDYYDDRETTAPGRENGDNINHSNAGKLYNFEAPEGKQTGEVVLTKKNAGKLFLVGNPFMAHLDMREFFKGNTTLPKKFWIMSEDQQLTGVFDENGDMILNGAVSADGENLNNDNLLLAPMQGFFVEAPTDVSTLTIKFTPDMMAVKPYAESNGLLLKAPARQTRADGDDIIRVSTEGSSAIILLNENADKGYSASEDVEMIDDSNQRGLRRVYTIAGNMATAINQTPDADGVEVGLMAPADSVTTVTLNGLALEDYLLYDMATGEMTPLYDGFTIEMKGSVSGRYFITSGVDTSEIEDGSIRIEPQGGEIVVTAPAACGELTVRVYDTLGREVAKAEGCGQEARIRVSQGIYAVDARGADHGRRSAKISIK